MRILELIDVRWWNACAYYAVELARGLRAAGDEVVVAGGPLSPPVERARAAGLEVWGWQAFDERRPLRALAGLPRFVRELERRRFDVIDAHRAPGQVWAALATLRQGGPPLVRTRGDVRPPRRHRLERWLQRRRTAAHVVPSRFMQRAVVERLGIDPARVHVVPAGIDVEHFAPGEHGGVAWRARYGIPREAPLVAVVARLSPVKGHRVLLEALARSPVAGIAHVCFGGQQEEVAVVDLERRAQALGLGERLHCVGRLDDVRPLLAAADLVAIPSLGSEAICRVLLEAMAMGRAVVASRVGVIGEVAVDGITGTVVAPDDVDALAAALGALLTPWPAARARLRGLGEAARARAVAEYALSRWVGRTRQVYATVCARSLRGAVPAASRGET